MDPPPLCSAHCTEVCVHSTFCKACAPFSAHCLACGAQEACPGCAHQARLTLCRLLEGARGRVPKGGCSVTYLSALGALLRGLVAGSDTAVLAVRNFLATRIAGRGEGSARSFPPELLLAVLDAVAPSFRWESSESCAKLACGRCSPFACHPLIRSGQESGTSASCSRAHNIAAIILVVSGRSPNLGRPVASAN